MTGYTKLFSSIIASTIWRESKETKILWITMLAMKNKDGIVEGAVPGLADMARLSLNETISALKNLMSPDEYSRTKEFEGRRIQEIDGGWLVLNHEKWRKKMNADERREYLKVKQREHRARVNKSVNNRKQVSTKSTHPEADTDAKTETRESASHSCPSVEEIYLAYPRREKKTDALRAIQKALKTVSASFLLERTKAFAATQEPYSRFTPLPASWFNAERFNDDPKEWSRNDQSPQKKQKEAAPIGEAYRIYDPDKWAREEREAYEKRQSQE